MERLAKKHDNGEVVLFGRHLASENNLTTAKLEKLADKLAEYEEAEEQGMLVRMPCKVGDTVYVICAVYDDNYYLIDKEIREYTFSFSFYYETTEIMQYELGVDWFLTKAEALQALKKEKK